MTQRASKDQVANRAWVTRSAMGGLASGTRVIGRGCSLVRLVESESATIELFAIASADVRTDVRLCVDGQLDQDL